jgi:hypothetical protein
MVVRGRDKLENRGGKGKDRMGSLEFGLGLGPGTGPNKEYRLPITEYGAKATPRALPKQPINSHRETTTDEQG